MQAIGRVLGFFDAVQGVVLAGTVFHLLWGLAEATHYHSLSAGVVWTSRHVVIKVVGGYIEMAGIVWTLLQVA